VNTMLTRSSTAVIAGIAFFGAASSFHAQAPGRRSSTIDRCSFVTESEAERILGKRLGAPRVQPNRDCWYLREGGSDFGDVELIISILPVQMKSEKDFDTFVANQVKDTNARLKKSGVGMLAFTATPAKDVGAPAYFIDPGLYVLKGNSVLVVVPGEPKGIAIAKTALKRMP
jgi:hypothetical protein